MPFPPPLFLERGVELELALILTQMAQKPVLRAEMYARALRASQNVRERESGGIGGRDASDEWARCGRVR